MEGIIYILIVVVCVYILINAFIVNVIHPEQGAQMRSNNKYKIDKYNSMHTENCDIKCPKCGSTQIQLMKRGWKITTGLLGSSKNERVCINCKHKF